MAATTATRPASAAGGGTVVTAAAVSSSDTISAADLGQRGALLVVINGSGGSINVGVSDSGLTDAGSAAAASSVAVANGVTRAFYISPAQLSAAGLVTVTYSATTTVTYYLLPIG